MMFAALTARLWYLQVLATQTFVESANNTSLKFIPVDASRGRILDASGKRVLVDNRQSLEITVQQQELAEADNPEAVLLRLSEHLGVPVQRITRKLQDPQYYDYQPIPVAADVSQDDIFYIAEHQDEFHGVSWAQASVREYPYGPLAAHVLGTVGLISSQDIRSGDYDDYGTNETVGKAGLEKTYEKFLRGTPGTDKIVVNPAGKQLRALGRVERPMPGDDVQLYLDARLQRQVEADLQEGIEHARGVFDEATGRTLVANAGAAVVMDPETFGVEAVASWPGYDPSWFVKDMTPEQERKRLLPEKAGQFYDRAVQAAYAPGSTFKPFVALAAVENGITTLGSYTDCPSSYAYRLDPEHPFDNWSTYDQGSLSIPEALKVSCDTVFYQWGAAFYDRWRANPLGANAEPFQRDLKGFGFGHEPGIDLPSSGSGFIPTAAWKEQQHEVDPKAFPYGWLPGDDILMSIGQGYVTTSPLQMATAYSAIANGGRLCEPRLAQLIRSSVDGKIVHRIGAQDCHDLPYAQQELDVIKSGLQQVVQESGGTAAAAFTGFPFDQVPVAGKTGTAERPGFGANQDTAWFAAIVGAPEHPEHVVVVMVEQGGHGSTTAAPIARRIIEGMYGIESSGPVSGGVTD